MLLIDHIIVHVCEILSLFFFGFVISRIFNTKVFGILNNQLFYIALNQVMFIISITCKFPNCV